MLVTVVNGTCRVNAFRAKIVKQPISHNFQRAQHRLFVLDPGCLQTGIAGRDIGANASRIKQGQFHACGKAQ